MEKNTNNDNQDAITQADVLLTAAMAKSSVLQKRNYTPAIALLALILAIVAILISDVDIKRFSFHESQTINRVKSTQQLFDEQQQIISQFQPQLAELKNVQQNLLLQSANNAASIERLLQTNSSSQQRWTLAEALHLVKLADYYLKFNHNKKIAIALLEAADQRLSHFGAPSLLSSRQMIADTLTELKALPTLDLAGLLVRINSLQQMLANLSLTSEIAAKTTKPSSLATPSATAWRQTINDGWQQLQKIVVIRHHTSTTDAWLAPDQKSYLIQHTQLLLQQAQWALLQGDQQIYNVSLQQANQLIKQYFSMSEAATQSVLTDVINLQQIDIAPKLPDLTKLIVALQKDQEQAPTKAMNKDAPVKKSADKTSSNSAAKE